MELLKLEPLFKERIWGGTKLKDLFDYPIPSDQTGEVWGVSGHPNGSNIIKNRPYRGIHLQHFFHTHRHKFKLPHSESQFPLLTKIIDAKSDLSVQVHPTDSYENNTKVNGKTECWYILDAGPDASIIHGHTAQTFEQFKSKVTHGDWSALLREVKVKKGDFIYVPAGTLHAIKKNIVLLEVQQSSDITFRVYDYDRTDAHGRKRPLHLEEAFQSIKIPDEQIPFIAPKRLPSAIEKLRFISNEFFTVERWHINKPYQPLIDGFKIFVALEGSGRMGHEPIKKGEYIVVLGDKEPLTIEGKMTLMVAWK